MASSFMGIEIGKRSILTHQAALNTTGHNVANASTTGYSRQVADIVTTIPYPVPSLTDGQKLGQLGTGVDIEAINRMRDAFTDDQIRSENQVYGYWKQLQDGLDKVETIINEPTDEGIRSVMDQFWQSWQDLSATPESEAVRSVVIQRGLALAEAFKSSFEALTDLRDDLNAAVKTTMNDINTYAINISDLNQQILAITSAGMQPNDLLDKRDLLVDELSEMADVEVFQKDNGMIDVQLGDRLLVQGKDSYKLTSEIDDEGMYMVTWEDTQLKAQFNNGEMKGLLDLRGKTGLQGDRYSEYKELVPDMINNLNELAKTLVVKINELHRGGYGLNNQNGCPDGSDFFDMPTGDPDVYENWADSMGVNQDLVDDVKNLAAASHRTWKKDSDNQDVRANFGDGSTALLIAQLKHDLNADQYPVKTESLNIDFDTTHAAAHNQVSITIDVGTGPQTITLDPPANYRDMQEMAEALQEKMDAIDLPVKVRIEGKDDGTRGEFVFYTTIATNSSIEFMYENSGFTDLSASKLQNGEYSLTAEREAAAGTDDASLNLLQQYLQGNAGSIFDAAIMTLNGPTNANASLEMTIQDVNTATNIVTYSYIAHEYLRDGTYTNSVGTFDLKYGDADSANIMIGDIQLDFAGLTNASELNLKELDKALYNVVAANTAGAYQKLTIAADYNHNAEGQRSQAFVFDDGVLDNAAIDMHFITLNDNPRSDNYGTVYDGFITLTTGTLDTPANSGGPSAYVSFYDSDNMETFMIGQQTTDDFWRSVAAEVGVKNQEATRMVKNEDLLLNELETKRQSVSGVSMDEEMTNMIKFNHGFSAASRFITTIDEQLDTIINRMGSVGR